MLICNDEKYYLRNSNLVIELRDLKTAEKGKVTSKIVNKDGGVDENKEWVMSDNAWKNFPENMSLEFRQQHNRKGHCRFTDEPKNYKMEKALLCIDGGRYLQTINLKPL